jgi:hypothetical protein
MRVADGESTVGTLLSSRTLGRVGGKIAGTEGTEWSSLHSDVRSRTVVELRSIGQIRTSAPRGS